MNYSINWLKDQLEQNTPIEYLFFGGHSQKMEHVIDKSCFSQWYPSIFKVDGFTYTTTEQWMMAKKASLFDDNETLKKILTAEKPALIKTLGREVKNFDDDKWSKLSYQIVVEGNKHKFSQNDALKRYLLQTDNKIIVEASPVDTTWGIGLAQDVKEAADPFKWEGTNWLGFALMEVRDYLKTI